ncbi:MAG: phytoene desaturase [Candidatus Firestonebacteria bacterium]|nr:phytoene desaturase [Candidatus Firestonebacteria bacterium]
MILARRGFGVTVVEKEKQVGGRNAALHLKKFKFDTGPTFLMLKDILDEVFEEAGRHSDSYLDFVKLEPMYHLQFNDLTISPTSRHEDMRAQIQKHFPGQEAGLDRYLQKEKKRFEHMYPCQQRDYATFGRFFSREFRRALPYLALGRTLIGVLGDYFKPEKLRLAFTFQAKYLGMSPWECPGAFSIISYIEHAFGIYHVQGGLSEISEAMAEVVKEHGGKILLGAKVRQLILEGRAVRGVELENGKKLLGDEVIINADFAQAMTHLVPPGVLRKYTPQGLQKRDYSCSTFMLYLGLDKLYKMPHHTIVFAQDYRTNVDDIFKRKKLSNDVSVYIRNASVTDPSLAPKGQSALYVLVPVANLSSGIDWAKEKDAFRAMVLKTITTKTPMKDLEKHIVVEKVITPADWEADYNVFYGATFNLAHSLKQMLYFRPRNRFEELEHCYLTGGGTHPGSGLPTIYESGRITANLISRQHGVSFVSKNLVT